MKNETATAQGGFPGRKLIRVAKPFFTSEKKWMARTNLGIILALMFANNWIGAYIVQTQGHFMTAVEQRNMPNFEEFLLIWVGLVLIPQPIVSTMFNMLKTRLAIRARSWNSTAILFHGYFANFAWYKMLSNKDVDNPDQRMTAETDAFWNTLIGLSISVADSLTQIAMYSYVLWTLMPMLPLEVFGATMAPRWSCSFSANCSCRSSCSSAPWSETSWHCASAVNCRASTTSFRSRRRPCDSTSPRRVAKPRRLLSRMANRWPRCKPIRG